MLNDIKDKYKKLPVQAKASLWFLFCSILQKGISTITTPIFTRLMSTKEYGEFSTFLSWQNIVAIIVAMGLSYGVYTQALIKYDKDRDRLTSSLQGLTLFLCTFWTVIYLLFKEFWNALFGMTSTQVLAMILITWTTAVFSFWATKERVTYSYKKLVTLTLIVSLMQPIVGITMVICAEDKVTARILALALVELLGYGWLFFIQIKKGKAFFSRKYWKYALLFNLPLIPHYLAQTVLNSADRIMIRDIVGTSEAGIYGLAYAIALVMMIFNSALSQTLTPWMFQKIKDQRIKEITPIVYLSLVIVIVVNLLLILGTPELVRLFAPIEYYDAIWLIPPIAMSVVFNFSYDIFSKFEFYYEKTQYIMIASVLGALANIILNFIFIKKYGYIAAAYTTLVCYMLYALFHYMLMDWICGRYAGEKNPYNTKVLLGMYTCLLVAGFGITCTYNYFSIRYAIAFIVIMIALIKRRSIIENVKIIIDIKKVE